MSPPRELHGPKDDIVRYFEVAGPDYAAWSKAFNMHFGYWTKGMNPFRREPMLERMNVETLARLQLDSGVDTHVADMGCGLGATARSIAGHSPNTRVVGFTIVPWQVANGNRLSREHGFAERVNLVLSDYHATPCTPGALDGAYAIESSCYAGGRDKADLVAEMARIVRRGGRVVISDGFHKDTRPLNPLLQRVYRISCRSWAIQEMGEIGSFTSALERHGFRDVHAEEVSWRAAPSFVHIPFLCVKFTLQRWLVGEFAWPKERWQNLLGPLFGAVLGLHRRRFGYYLVTAVRGDA